MLLLGESRLVVHDLSTGVAAEVPLELMSGVTSFDLSPDGQFLVATQFPYGSEPRGRLFCRALADLASSVWSIDTSGPINDPPLFLAGGEQFVVFELRPSPPPHHYGLVYVTRDARTGHVLAEVAAANDRFRDPVLSADRRLIAAHRGTCIAVFRANDFAAEPVKLRNDNRKEFTGLAFHPSGRYLAATSNDATVKLYDTTTWTLAEAYNWTIGRLRSVAFSPDGMLAAAGGDKGKIVVWDVDL
jgi:WD40 repeat protein